MEEEALAILTCRLQRRTGHLNCRFCATQSSQHGVRPSFRLLEPYTRAGAHDIDESSSYFVLHARLAPAVEHTKLRRK